MLFSMSAFTVGMVQSDVACIPFEAKNRDELYAAVDDYTFNNNTNKFCSIRKWKVGKVTDFSYVLAGLDSFNEDISEWDMSSAITAAGMLENASLFNQLEIGM